MPYVLDGNNLIGRERRSGRASEEDRAALVRELADRLRRTRARAVVVFDGPAAPASTLGSLCVRQPGGSADEAILREVRRSASPREIVVVTADRELARRAREAGAKSVSPEAFWKSFGTAGGEASSDEPAAVDVEEWTRYFSDERNRG